MVGFQTKLKHGAQVELFRTIPGLEKAEFARLGGLHRNTFIQSPKLLDGTLRLKSAPHIRFAGQVTGCEGYVESAAIGLLAGRFAAAEILGRPLAPLPPETALGALLGHVTGNVETADYQPMNVNFGLFPPLDAVKKKQRKEAMTSRARAALGAWLGASAFGGGRAFRRGRREFRWGQPAVAIAVRLGKAIRRRHRPLLEGEEIVIVAVERLERLDAAAHHLDPRDEAVAIAVVAAKALLLAALRRRFARHGRRIARSVRIAFRQGVDGRRRGRVKRRRIIGRTSTGCGVGRTTCSSGCQVNVASGRWPSVKLTWTTVPSPNSALIRAKARSAARRSRRDCNWNSCSCARVARTEVTRRVIAVTPFGSDWRSTRRCSRFKT